MLLLMAHLQPCFFLISQGFASSILTAAIYTPFPSRLRNLPVKKTYQSVQASNYHSSLSSSSLNLSERPAAARPPLDLLLSLSSPEPSTSPPERPGAARRAKTVSISLSISKRLIQYSCLVLPSIFETRLSYSALGTRSFTSSICCVFINQLTPPTFTTACQGLSFSQFILIKSPPPNAIGSAIRAASTLSRIYSKSLNSSCPCITFLVNSFSHFSFSTSASFTLFAAS